MKLSVADLRRNYTQGGLLESEASTDPFQQFRLWFEQAIAAEVPEPNAMTLATIAADGSPDARMVLLKDVNIAGFVFFTNYNSQKGQQLRQHPQAALVFWWAELERQVRITGAIAPISAAESDAYFAIRPHGSQLGAWASPQSEVVPDRASLEARLAQLEQEYANQTIPRPPHWGGYRLTPKRIEFWQGRPNRLHDRLCYTRSGEDQWQRQRLAP